MKKKNLFNAGQKISVLFSILVFSFVLIASAIFSTPQLPDPVLWKEVDLTLYGGNKGFYPSLGDLDNDGQVDFLFPESEAKVLSAILSPWKTFCYSNSGALLWVNDKDCDHTECIWAGNFIEERPGPELIIQNYGHIANFISLNPDYTANHFETGDTYFKAMEYFLYMGRKIAHDYFDSRGAFVQITGYPIYAEDDPYGSGFCSRMVYMTGWALNQYWRRYLYSQDKNWLQDVGYPALREGALFFTDFLIKGEDGLYHAFPCQSGEKHWRY